MKVHLVVMKVSGKLGLATKVEMNLKPNIRFKSTLNILITYVCWFFHKTKPGGAVFSIE